MIAWWCTTWFARAEVARPRPAGAAPRTGVRPARTRASRRCLTPLAFLTVLLALSAAHAATPRAAHAATLRGALLLAVPRDTVLVVPAIGAVNLPDRFVVRASETVWAGDDTLRRGLDYSLDAGAGVLQLFRPVPAARVRIRYDAVPTPLAVVYGHRAPGTPGGAPIALPVAPFTPRDVNAPSGTERSATADSTRWAQVPRDLSPRTRGALEVRGNKTVAVDIGSNRDATLRQSLDLSLSGTLAPGVTLAGALSDQSIPLSAGGASTTLRELDRVWLTVQAQSTQLLFGDYDLQPSATAGAFATASRRLNGARLATTVRGLGLDAQIAQSRGRWVSREFFGSDGVQGPYAVLGAGTSAADVVPSSERVYLDGVLLRRGEAADYLVDEGRGTITFSTRHPITARSRVSLDVQVGQQDLSRGYAEMRARRAWGTTTSEWSWMREADGAGVTSGLSDADRAVLRAAGDSATAALLAVHEVGAGKGDYERLAADSVSTARFRFVGERRGSFTVDFLFVGTGRGDYAVVSDSSSVHYEYAGATAGSYTIGRRVPAPTAADVLDWTVREVRVGALRAGFEGALSRNDRNTLSPLNDGDNWGAAGTATLAVTALPLRLGGRRLGALDVSAEGREHAARFQGLSRSDDAATTARWGLAPDATEHGARTGTLRSQWRVGRGLSAEGVVSALRLGDGLSARAWTGSVAGEGAFTWRARHERTAQVLTQGTSLTRDRDGLSAEYTRGAFRPLVHVTREERFGAVRDGLLEWEAGALYTSGQREATRAQLTILRRDDRSAGAGVGGVHARGVRGAGRAGGDRASATFDAEGWWRHSGNSAPPSLARLTLDVAPGAGALHASLAGTLTARALSGDRRDVIFAGIGAGHYDSLGVYSGTGDYDVRVLASTDTTRATQTTLSWSLAGDGGRAFAGGRESAVRRALRAIHLTQLVTIRAVSQRAAGDLPWFRAPARWIEDTATSSGDVLLRHEAEWTPPGGTLRVRGERTAARETPYLNDRRTRQEADLAGLLRRDHPRWGSLETEWTHRRRWSDAVLAGAAGGTSASFRVREDEWRVTASPRRGGRVRVDLSAGGLAQRDAITGGTRDRWSLRPEASWTPRPTTRVDARGTWVRERRRGTVALGVGLLAGAGEPADELHLTVDQHLGERVTGTLGWDVQRFALGGTVQTGRAEVRATF